LRDVGWQICFPSDRDHDQVTGGRSVYRSIREDAVFNLTVAELADTGLGESAVIERAIKKISDDRLHRRYFNVEDAIRDAEQGSPAE
jgi:hypothetical protein